MQGPAALPVYIAGVGRYLPKRVVGNHELPGMDQGMQAWVADTLGVRQRHWVEDPRVESASFMAAEAVREAVAMAGVSAGDIDLIINASGTPQQLIPDGGPHIQRHLGLGNSGVASYSMHATCLSFLVALEHAGVMLAAGRANTVVVASSDITSVGLDPAEKEVISLFGDAAAAVVLTRPPAGSAACIEALRIETYGNGADLTRIEGCGTRFHPNSAHSSRHHHSFHMDGARVLQFTIARVPDFLERLRPGLCGAPADIDRVIPHQPSRMGLDVLQEMGFEADRVVETLAQLGNCVAASIPCTLYAAIESGRLERGQRCLMLGTGAGISLGGAVLIY